MKFKHILASLLCIPLLSGCIEITDRIRIPDIASDEEFSKIVFAMDTEMTLKAYGENASDALSAAESEVRRLDDLLRRGSEGSEVYKINTEGALNASDDTAELTNRALEICAETDGAFDISIAPIMDLWGFYTKEFYVPSAEEVRQALAEVDYRNILAEGEIITVNNGAKIDLGGIAKGYLSSRLMDIFKEYGVESGIVSLGGNVETLGEKPDGSKWRVAVQYPGSEGYIGSVSVSDKAVVTSGGYQRYFEQDGEIYHHIIDPSTGYPAKSGVKSVTIVSGDGTLADGLSTALFVMGLEGGAKYWRNHDGFDVIFVTDDDKIYITDGLVGVFEGSSDYSVITK